MVREDTSIQQWVRVTGCFKDDWDGKFWLSNKMWPTVRDINNITRRNWSNWNGETLTGRLTGWRLLKRPSMKGCDL